MKLSMVNLQMYALVFRNSVPGKDSYLDPHVEINYKHIKI